MKKNDLECGEDIEKYLYQTSILIDWDRRKTLRVDPIMGVMYEDGGSILWGEELDNGEPQCTPNVWHAMKHERDMDIPKGSKCNGIGRR